MLLFIWTLWFCFILHTLMNLNRLSAYIIIYKILLSICPYNYDLFQPLGFELHFLLSEWP